jgi:hypothetical protein
LNLPRLRAFWCVALGLPEEELWRCTPRLLHEHARVYAEVNRRADLRAGVIAAAIVNTRAGRRRGSRGVKPEDFFQTRRASAAPDDLWLRARVAFSRAAPKA